MKVLLVNKFLYPKGGAETYLIKLGEYFQKNGHEVQYFGIENKKNILKNNWDLYTKEYDLSKNSFKNIINVFSLIYSINAKEKMYKLLKLYNPDLIILNNIEYYLTPSIILAIKKYKNKHRNIKLFYVAHDYQLICPSHGLFDSNINICEKCLDGNYWNCYKTKCLKKSRLKSLIGTLDSIYWHKRKIYKNVDKIICPSKFLKNKLDTQNEFKNKTIAIHNFVDKTKYKKYKKEDYIIYFGKLCKEKGTETLLKVVAQLPNIKFIFAGYGQLENEVSKYKNIKFVGFKSGEELIELISKAKLSIYPSEWYENCPFSVIESQMYGTPVIGSNMGGIPELIDIGKTGEIFEPKNMIDLKNKILKLWDNKELLDKYSNNCENIKIETIDSYLEKIIDLYKEN